METLLEIIKQHCLLCDGDDELDDYIKEIIHSEKIIPIRIPPHLLFCDANGNGTYSIPLSREQYNILKELFE